MNSLSKNFIILMRSTIRYSGSRCLSDNNIRNIITSPYKGIIVPSGSITEYVWKNLDQWSNKTALVSAETGQEIKYGELHKMSMTFGAALKKKLKLNDGDVVGVMLPNIPEYPVAVFGSLQAGCVVSTFNPLYTADEVSRQIELSDARLIITTNYNYTVVKGAIEKLKKPVKIMLLAADGESIYENTLRFSEFSKDFSIDISTIMRRTSKPNDLAFLPYSSGTTGLPKGVELTHGNILANCEQIVDPAIDVTLPTTTLFLGGHPSVKREHFDSMRVIVNGAAPLGATDVQRILSKAKKEDLSIVQGYGLTETSPVIAIQEIGSTKYASIGYPAPSTDVKIVSLEDCNENLGAYQEGELYVRGPQVMRGYRNNPQANAEVFVDGWFRTGDLAYYDDTDSLYITDRVKELIKVKGYQVAPAELEAVLRVHPSIGDVAVIGIPHPKDGETPKAFIVRKPGKDLTEQEIKKFLSEKVAPYKMVTSIQYVDAIPKSAAGKILRKELKNV